jgi:5-(carboxyamino)imidazole ribonucleotide synthase
MLGLAAESDALGFRFLDPSPDATAAAVGELIVARLDDEAAAAKLAQGADVVTYEWEGVPATTARAAGAHAPLRPNDRALEVSQDRLDEKQLFQRLGIAVPPFAAIDDRAGLDDAVRTIGLPAVLKTRRGGYDGKGQQVLRDTSDAETAWGTLGGVPLVLERLVSFDRELSVLAARGLDGATRIWPLVHNEHRDGILRISRAPAPDLSAGIQAAGEQIATRLLDELDYVGVLAVELFEHDGSLLANELAPRVHNSGHWTIEGAETSQFRQHLNAILGEPLGPTDMRGHAAMVNCIGVFPDAAAVASIDGAYLHDYGKEPRPGRKLGHITLLASAEAELETRLDELEAAVPELFA